MLRGCETLSCLSELLAACKGAAVEMTSKLYLAIKDILLLLLADNHGRLLIAAAPGIVVTMVNTLSTTTFLPADEDLDVVDAFGARACLELAKNAWVHNPHLRCPPTALALQLLYFVHTMGHVDGFLGAAPHYNRAGVHSSVFHLRRLVSMSNSHIGRAAVLSSLMAHDLLGVDWLLALMTSAAPGKGPSADATSEGAIVVAWSAALLAQVLQEDTTGSVMLRCEASRRDVLAWLSATSHPGKGFARAEQESSSTPARSLDLGVWLLGGTSSEVLTDTKSLLKAVQTVALKEQLLSSSLVALLGMLRLTRALLRNDTDGRTLKDLVSQGAAPVFYDLLTRLTEALLSAKQEGSGRPLLVILSLEALLSFLRQEAWLTLLRSPATDDSEAERAAEALLHILGVCFRLLPSVPNQPTLEPAVGDGWRSLEYLRLHCLHAIIGLLRPSNCSEGDCSGSHRCKAMASKLTMMATGAPELVVPWCVLFTEVARDATGTASTERLSSILGDEVGSTCSLIMLAATTSSPQLLQTLQRLVVALAFDETLLSLLAERCSSTVVKCSTYSSAAASSIAYRSFWLLLQVVGSWSCGDSSVSGVNLVAPYPAIAHVLNLTKDSAIAMMALNTLAFVFHNCVEPPPELVDPLLSALKSTIEGYGGDRDVAWSAARALRYGILMDQYEDWSKVLVEASRPLATHLLTHEIRAWREGSPPSGLEVVIELAGLLATAVAGGDEETRQGILEDLERAIAEAGLPRSLPEQLAAWAGQGFTLDERAQAAVSWLADPLADPTGVLSSVHSSVLPEELLAADIDECFAECLEQLRNKNVPASRGRLDLNQVARTFCPDASFGPPAPTTTADVPLTSGNTGGADDSSNAFPRLRRKRKSGAPTSPVVPPPNRSRMRAASSLQQKQPGGETTWRSNLSTRLSTAPHPSSTSVPMVAHRLR